jgi:hypothetical protein
MAQQKDFEGWKLHGFAPWMIHHQNLQESHNIPIWWWQGGEEIRGQVGGGGSLLMHQAYLRGARVSKEVRQHGEGDGHEGLALQHLHADDAARRIVIEHSISCPIVQKAIKSSANCHRLVTNLLLWYVTLIHLRHSQLCPKARASRTLK